MAFVEHIKYIDFRSMFYFFFNCMKVSSGRELLKLIWSGLLPLKFCLVQSVSCHCGKAGYITGMSITRVWREYNKRLRFNKSNKHRNLLLSACCSFYKLRRIGKDSGAVILVNPLNLEVFQLWHPLETAKTSMEKRSSKISEYFKCEWVAFLLWQEIFAVLLYVFPIASHFAECF